MDERNVRLEPMELTLVLQKKIGKIHKKKKPGNFKE
jgi:hypothetical protein